MQHAYLVKLGMQGRDPVIFDAELMAQILCDLEVLPLCCLELSAQGSILQ